MQVPDANKETLRSLRVKFGYTQQEAAKLLGVSLFTLRNWEKDSSDIPLNYAAKIADLYLTDMGKIYFGKEFTFSEQLRKLRKKNEDNVEVAK